MLDLSPLIRYFTVKSSAVEVNWADGVGKMRVVRAGFHAELDELTGDLASMGRLASQIMINASAALLQADLVLAELVITRGDEMDARHHDVEQRSARDPAGGDCGHAGRAGQPPQTVTAAW